MIKEYKAREQPDKDKTSKDQFLEALNRSLEEETGSKRKDEHRELLEEQRQQVGTLIQVITGAVLGQNLVRSFLVPREEEMVVEPGQIDPERGVVTEGLDPGQGGAKRKFSPTFHNQTTQKCLSELVLGRKFNHRL